MKVMKTLFPFVAIATALMLVAGAQGDSTKAKIGEAAPDFTLKDTDGTDVTLSSYAGKIVVLEWFNQECPYVVRWYKDGQTNMNTLAAKYAEKDVVWLAINTTKGHSVEADKKIRETWKINHPILNDADGKVGRAYGAKTTPHMYIIDKEGRLVYAGGIDDDQSGRKGESATNYVAKALDELLAGESVSTPESQPYGCSIKY